MRRIRAGMDLSMSGSVFPVARSNAVGPGRQGGQALAGAEAQEERLNGCELQSVFQMYAVGRRQLFSNDMKMEFVLVLFHRLNLGLDVVGVEPEHEVGHINHLSKNYF